MKKSLAAIALAAVASTALTGCYKENTSLKVTSKAVTGEVKALLDNNLIDFMQAQDTETPGAADMTRREYVQAYFSEDGETGPGHLPRGVAFKVVSGKDFSGIKLVFTKAPLKTVNAVGRSFGPNARTPLVKVKLDAKKRIQFTYNVFGGKHIDLTPQDVKSVPAGKYKVTAKFPGKVVKTNGKVKKKRTVVWSGKHTHKGTKLTATAKRR